MGLASSDATPPGLDWLQHIAHRKGCVLVRVAPGEYDELLALAAEATPGPWGANREAIYSLGDAVGTMWRNADATFVAAVSPDVVTALIQENQALKQIIRGAVAGLTWADDKSEHPWVAVLAVRDALRNVAEGTET